MARLGVNIYQVAALREIGKREEPDPVSAVVFAELGGADGIVCPLTEEFLPVTERDVRLLKEMVKTHFNIQVPPSEQLISMAISILPDMITLIPGKKPGSTPGGGLDVMGHINKIAKIIGDIRQRDVVVSVMIDPNIHQVKAAAKAGADYVEFHLGVYASAQDLNERSDQVENLSSVAAAASKLELGVAAGQGLNYQNVHEIAAIQPIEELNVGHAVVARALSVGMEVAVRDMVALVH